MHSSTPTPSTPTPSTSTPSTSTPSPTRRLALAGIVLAPFGLAACGQKDDPSTASDAGASDAGGADPNTSGTPPLHVADAWAKAAATGMTAAFATLTNPGSVAVHITSATSPVSPMVQLHETVAGTDGGSTMREKKDGFVVPPGGTLTLEPGGDHIMLMDITEPLEAGSTLALTLHLEDGGSVDVEAQVKDFAGAKEDYGDMSDGGGEH